MSSENLEEVADYKQKREQWSELTIQSFDLPSLTQFFTQANPLDVFDELYRWLEKPGRRLKVDSYVMRLSFEHLVTLEDEETKEEECQLVIAAEVLEVEKDKFYCVDFRLQGCKLISGENEPIADTHRQAFSDFFSYIKKETALHDFDDTTHEEVKEALNRLKEENQ